MSIINRMIQRIDEYKETALIKPQCIVLSDEDYLRFLKALTGVARHGGGWSGKRRGLHSDSIPEINNVLVYKESETIILDNA